MKASEPHTAVIADDEPLLVASLKQELTELWPELNIVATVNNGPAAIEAIVEHAPTVVFLDIKMPGATGLEVAQSIAEDWPEQAMDQPVPLVVFATAFNEFALEAYDTAAIDYLVKPIKPERLAKTVDRLKERLATNQNASTDELAQQLHRWIVLEQQNTNAQEKLPKLKIVRASMGNTTKIIPIDDVILFESKDKYVTVYTADETSLIREPLKKLLPQLDDAKFEQVHRGAIVNITKIERAHRDETGKVTLTFSEIEHDITVSRVYRHLFQPM